MESYDNLIVAYDEYIKLLGEELDSLVGMAYVHGWQSTEEKINKGEELRAKIETLKKEVEQDDEKIFKAFMAHYDLMDMKRTILNMLYDANDFEFISFYYYPSGTRVRLLEQSHNGKTPEHDLLEEFGEKLLDKFEAVTKHRRDNKIVIEFKVIDKNNESYHTPLFLGWHDGKFNIGLEAFNYDNHPPVYLKDKNAATPEMVEGYQVGMFLEGCEKAYGKKEIKKKIVKPKE